MLFPFSSSNSPQRTCNDHEQLQVELLENRMMLSTVQIFAAGTTNQEIIELQIGDQTVATYSNLGTGAFSGQYQSRTFNTAASVTANDVRIQFVNDFNDTSTGFDRNVRVDAIVIDGVRYETESPDVFSTGTWRPSDGVQPGFRQSEYLHSNGYFQYAGGGGNNSTQITVNARGSEGTEAFALQIDGQNVQTWNNINTVFSSYNFTAIGSIAPEQVRVVFLNDQWDPVNGIDANLIVDDIVVGGVQYETESSDVFSTGTWRAEDGIVQGFGRGDTLHTNGYFQYPADNNSSDLRVQAESGSTFGPQAQFEDVHDNFDGTGFIGFLVNQGDGLDLNVNVENAVSYDFDIRYAAGQAGPSSDRTITLFVNGSRVDQLSMSRTGSWSSWHNYVQQVDLRAGNNTIRFEVTGGDTGFINLDYIDIRPFAGRLDLGSTTASLLNDSTTFSSTILNVRKLATLPTFPDRGNQATRRIINVANRPDDPDGIYTASQDGRVFRVSASTGAISFVFDADDFITVARQNFQHGGLRSIAFHPDFADSSKAGYGKIYATLMANSNDPNANYIGSSQGNVDSVVAEFNFNFTPGVGVDGFRELFRVRNPQFDHPIKDLSFNTAALPGDLDYGLLYIAHGDGSIFSANIGNGLVTNDALGKILRINPLQSGNQAYTTPGNVFATDGDPLTLAEVYTWGHRNPHNISFGRNDDGSTFLLAAEIGQDSVEEVNLIRISNNSSLGDNGQSYGWGDRTGTFEKTGFGYSLGTGVESLRLDDGGREYVYPVLQLDQDDPNNNRSVAIAGGPVLNGRYLYGMFAGNANSPGGQIYSVDVNLLQNQKTTFNSVAGETTADLTFLDDNLQHRLNYNGQTYDTFAQLLTVDNGSFTNRSDFRFGQTADGRMIVTSKSNGTVYIVDNASSLPVEFA